MQRGRWRVRLAQRAERDFREIVRWTNRTFGTRQAQAYQELVADALEAIAQDPLLSGSKARDEIEQGVRTSHIGRQGPHGRHLLVYRNVEERSVEIGRILHERMELRKHLPDNVRESPDKKA